MKINQNKMWLGNCGSFEGFWFARVLVKAYKCDAK